MSMNVRLYLSHNIKITLTLHCRRENVQILPSFTQRYHYASLRYLQTISGA